MMNCILFAGAILVSLSYTNGRVAPFITPCKGTDKACIIKSAQAAIAKVAPGIPDLNVEPSDPLKIAEVIGDQGDLKLRFRDITITGASKCKVVNIDRNLEKKTLLLEAECPIKIVGDYEANGKFSILPIEGKDKFEISTDNIKIGVDAQLETVDGSDGKKHWHIASWEHTYQPIEKVKFDLKNLFHGNPQLADPISKLLDESWKDVTLEIGQPIVKELLKNVVNVVSQLFDAVPADELELD